jgi:hypothetical protein
LERVSLYGRLIVAQRNRKNGYSLKGFVLILENERPISNNKFYEGMHWAERKAEADRVHARVQAACASWKAKMGRPLPRFEHGARVIITAYFEKRPLDSSNIAGKLYEDGLVRAGILPNDDWKHVTELCTRSRLDKERPRVEIIVEPDSRP